MRRREQRQRRAAHRTVRLRCRPGATRCWCPGRRWVSLPQRHRAHRCDPAPGRYRRDLLHGSRRPRAQDRPRSKVTPNGHERRHGPQRPHRRDLPQARPAAARRLRLQAIGASLKGLFLRVLRRHRHLQLPAWVLRTWTAAARRPDGHRGRVDLYKRCVALHDLGYARRRMDVSTCRTSATSTGEPAAVCRSWRAPWRSARCAR